MTGLAELLAAERDEYAKRNPKSLAASGEATHLVGRVPMTWMAKNAGGFPLYLDRASGAHVTDIDGHELVDFCLGDTGAMAGHSPAPTVAAVIDRFAGAGGATAMMPTEDAIAVSAELTRRFGVEQWSFALTATDANRWALRLCRALTERPRILVNSYCYHGTVDESLVVTGDGARGAQSRPGNVGAPFDVTRTSRVAEYNDLDGLAVELAQGDVAAVLMEPALTNIGIVLPEHGYLEGVRRLTREHGVLLINDETHTISAGPGGCTQAWRLEPDVVTVGKAIGGGIPAAAYGLSSGLAERLLARPDLDLVDTGGVGGTLAGNALSLAATRATLDDVLTDAAFEHMISLATRYTQAAQRAIDEHGVAWSITQLGARAEFRFAKPAPRTGTESMHATDEQLDDFVHVFFANRGVLLTPFHNMALMCPATTEADVDLLVDVFTDTVRAVASSRRG
jgi:glutamate-1-semialdehyde 2,1-aminomutase